MRHFPTATFRSARAACRIRTPESLIRAIAGELVGLPAHDLDGLDRRLRLLGDPQREQHDRDHDHRGDRDHDDAEHDAELPLRGLGHQRDHAASSRARRCVVHVHPHLLAPARAGLTCDTIALG